MLRGRVLNLGMLHGRFDRSCDSFLAGSLRLGLQSRLRLGFLRRRFSRWLYRLRFRFRLIELNQVAECAQRLFAFLHCLADRNQRLWFWLRPKFLALLRSAATLLRSATTLLPTERFAMRRGNLAALTLARTFGANALR